MWIIALICSCAGALIILTSFFYKTAVQQTTVVAIGIAVTVIPYCIVRSLTEIINEKKRKKVMYSQTRYQRETKKCPECGEDILNKALSCIFCGHKYNLDDT
jgi:predicted RNA-binding Zn-ribbon protein involved in translation (DUF1610 family)